MEIIINDLRSFLNDVPEHHTFWFANGIRVKNLEELANILEKIEDHIFYHHVNDAKNDLSNWIRDCIGDMILVEAINPIKSKKEIAVKVKERVKELRSNKKSKKPAAPSIAAKKKPVKTPAKKRS
ncbi:hypothetical protein HY745_02965 [Candidatus Desantisbacteria bacterium]|nr:hypothetical protein [Candidatus Desantisbacteria bacterium]